ncbi:hypothetical protein, partial [Mesorhizobium sp.]
FKTLLEKNAKRLVWATSDRPSVTGLTSADNQVDGFALTAIRAPGNPAPAQVTAGAFDDKGRRIADATLTFAP